MRKRLAQIMVCAMAVAVIGWTASLPDAYAEVVNYPLPWEKPAKLLFGHKDLPANLAPRSEGSYARGCLAGGRELATTGSHWQAMRLSRNRNWGHPALIGYLERLAREAVENGDWPGLLVGDLSQPRGGPMLTGHASHQIGLDADIWLRASPGRELSRREREDISSTSVISGRTSINSEVWTERHARLIRRAASNSEVARIFVHPAIKKELCRWATGDRSWLRVVRPWYGHHYHFHVRLACPGGSNNCRNQQPPPAGDGCGGELNWWLSDEPYKPKPDTNPAQAARPVTINDLPDYCAVVLQADDQ